MHLYKTVVACTFGKRSSHMFRAAILRISFLYATALGLGWILAQGLAGLPLNHRFGLPMVFACLIALHTVILLCLCASSGLLRPGSRDVVNRLFLSLPLSGSTIWCAIVLPGFILAGIAASFAGPVFFSIFLQSQIWPITGILCMFAAALSAIGYLYGIPRQMGLKALCLLPFGLGAEYYSITNLAGTGLAQAVSYGFLLAVLLVGWVLLWLSKRHLPYEASVSRRDSRAYLAQLPSDRFWFLKKAARSPIMQSSSIATCVMSLAFVIASFRLGIGDISLCAIAAALLGTALAADTRALSRGRHPPEIIALRGSLRFVTAQITTVAGLAMILLLPIFAAGIYYLVQAHTSVASGITQLSVPLLVGLAAGFFSSTLITPGSRDISAQSSATLLAIGLLGLPQLPFLSSMSSHAVQLVQLVFAFLLLTLTYMTEHIRNPYTWRRIL